MHSVVCNAEIVVLWQKFKSSLDLQLTASA